MAPDDLKMAQNDVADVCASPTDSMPAEFILAEAREAADFLKALGHEGRLLMLCHLCDGDLSVTELEQLIMSRQAAVSQQLARLRHEKLVSTRREGNQIIYTLADDRVRTMIRLIQRLFGHQLRHPGDG